MARTPDRTPGPSIEEETQYEDRGVGNDPTIPGALRYVNGEFRMLDGAGVFNPRTGGGGGITEPQHSGLDSLVHLIAENSFEEVTYTGARVDAISIWTDSGKTVKIREELFTYVGNKVTVIVRNQYDGAGVLESTITETLTYTGSKLISIDRVLS